MSNGYTKQDAGDIQEFPRYDVLSIAIPANGEYVVNRLASTLTILDLSGSLKLSIDEADETDADAGITYRMPRGAKFRRLVFRETSGNPATVRIATGEGEIYDARSSISGNVSVQNAASPNQVLDVATDAADAGLVALAAAIVAALQASNDLRQRLISIDGASYHQESATGGGGETEIVSAAANTAGIIVHRCFGTSTNRDQDCYLKAGANIIFGKEAGSGATLIAGYSPSPLENMLLPAGVALNVRAQTEAEVHTWYTVLP